VARVSYEQTSGWSPAEAFQPPTPQKLVPDEAWSAWVPIAPPPALCDTHVFNEQLPIGRCDEGYAVEMIQRLLHRAGFPLQVDGDFGPSTELAVQQFRRDNALEVTDSSDRTRGSQ
jgi:hypothetical protein